jgi:hypothetical protein
MKPYNCRKQNEGEEEINLQTNLGITKPSRTEIFLRSISISEQVQKLRYTQIQWC